MSTRRVSTVTVALVLFTAGCSDPSGQGETPADAPAATPNVEPGGAEPAATPAAARSETRRFRDWIVTCDNGNDCVALSAAGNGEGWIRIAMAAGPDARPDLSGGLLSDGGTATPGLMMTVDGTRYALSGPGRAALPRDSRVALAAMATGTSASLATRSQSQTLSLSGVSAALLWIDERQGRLDTTTALLRRGDGPASRVPAPPPLPRVRAASAVDQAGYGEGNAVLPATVEALPEIQTCRADTDFSPEFQRAVQSARLNATTELWGVPCFSGAYNVGYRYVISGPGGQSPRAITLPTTAEPAETPINAEYDPATRILTAFAKGRGVGDCGFTNTWTWTGRDFALTSETRMEECWSLPADLWPITWRSQ
ncbi:DUF1176 domain-containing protein [Brevundimonas vitis]|uniref:DUF1176 domain-containing protein n=1 Tax=Brevundimonas vitisensis TaxID=2800818 RepID=A0ABX7BTJ9_9CAUL|nr:DUF1176 domain-containing protein [Brevundimonas vitisensis]QQQ19636.1 DUF1176 domain-containing protein [Brevundimonas vitisensis]